MKLSIRFVAGTTLAGLLVLLPLLLLYIILAFVAQLVADLTAPLVDLLVPELIFNDPSRKGLCALLVIIGLSFVIGLAARSAALGRIGSWAGARVPAYGTLRRLVASFGTSHENSSFRPALIVQADGSCELAYVVEELPDGRLVVMVPWAPSPFSGSIRILPADSVALLDVKLVDFIRVVARWGHGLGDLLDKPR